MTWNWFFSSLQMVPFDMKLKLSFSNLDQSTISLQIRNLRCRFSQIGLFSRRQRHIWRDIDFFLLQIYSFDVKWKLSFSNLDQSTIWLQIRNLRCRFSQLGLFSRRQRHIWRETDFFFSKRDNLTSNWNFARDRRYGVKLITQPRDTISKSGIRCRLGRCKRLVGFPSHLVRISVTTMRESMHARNPARRAGRVCASARTPAHTHTHSHAHAH